MHEVPAIHGQFTNLLADHDVRNVASRRIDSDGRGFHHHRFRGRSHFHLQIQSSHVGNVQLHTLQSQFLESALIHGEAVGTSFQLGEGEAAFLVGRRLASGSRAFIDHADRRARHSSAARVGHCPVIVPEVFCAEAEGARAKRTAKEIVPATSARTANSMTVVRNLSNTSFEFES